MARKKNLLSYPKTDYYPDILMSARSEREMRAEYTRLRDIGQKRIKRLMGSEFAASATANKWRAGIPKLSELGNKSDIAHALSDLASFISSPYSSISGHKEVRARQRAQIEKHFPGLDLSGKKFDAFTRFMNAETSNNIEKIFGSDRAVILFRTLQSKGVRNLNPFMSSPEKMAYWMANVENLAAVELPKGRHKSAKAYKELIESEIEHGRDRTPTRISGVDDIIRQGRKGRKRGKTRK